MNSEILKQARDDVHNKSKHFLGPYAPMDPCYSGADAESITDYIAMVDHALDRFDTYALDQTIVNTNLARILANDFNDYAALPFAPNQRAISALTAAINSARSALCVYLHEDIGKHVWTLTQIEQILAYEGEASNAE